ncbi:FkbM family methyltransferase [Saccharopolyspora sp. 5N708]|uniref:FkbM family methyltransferase n=1 Tax=Saccharopolyspora sp. 5N708 TaxID=3457424 RepID=UPI003FD30F7C
MTELDLVEIDGGFKCYSPASGNPVLTEAKLIYDEIFRRNTYLRGLKPISPTGFVVDAGANIGIFTLFIKRHFPKASVLAIEPIPHNVDALRANIRLYGVEGVTVHPEGLSDHAGSAQFYFFPSMPGNSTAHLDEKLKDKDTIATYANPAIAAQLYRHEPVRVPVRTLSEILRASASTSDSIELVKMDIEGGEEAALDGIEDPDWDRIKQIAIEVHEAQHSLERVLAKLRGKGFRAAAHAPAETPGGIDNRIVYATRD